MIGSRNDFAERFFARAPAAGAAAGSAGAALISGAAARYPGRP